MYIKTHQLWIWWIWPPIFWTQKSEVEPATMSYLLFMNFVSECCYSIEIINIFESNFLITCADQEPNLLLWKLGRADSRYAAHKSPYLSHSRANNTAFQINYYLSPSKTHRGCIRIALNFQVFRIWFIYLYENNFIQI